MKIPFWHRDPTDPAALVKAKADLAKLDASQSKSRADALEKVAAVERIQTDWVALLADGRAAADRLQRANEQMQILRDRHEVAAVEFDKLVGGELYTRDWHATVHANPLLNDNWVYGSGTSNENPFAFYAKMMSALETGIARIESRLPEFEQAEQAARDAAVRFAKSNGITHDLA